jgi:hypothetical protein
VKTAADIARLVRDPNTSFQHAVELIQLFAACEAHEASLRAIEQSGQATMRAIDMVFAPRVPA